MATISFSGELTEDVSGILEARISGKTLSSFAWQEVKLQNGSFSGSFADVPVGGPYAVEFRVRDKDSLPRVHRMPGILVGDLWIMAGQSNMEGCGSLINLEPPSRNVNAFYFGDYWQTAKDPLCWFNEAIEPVHWSTENAEERAAAAKEERLFRNCGAGMGVRFGKDMYSATGVPVGLIVCPHGGTSLAQWSPKLKDKDEESLYGAMLRRVRLAGGKVTGCLWYQGESDAEGTHWKGYKKLTRELIESLRADLEQPGMPFIYAQLAPYRIWGLSEYPLPGWNIVQNDQLLLEGEIDNVAFAAAIDSTLSDPIHIDAISQRRLGARFAKLARKLVFGEHMEVGPRPGKIEFMDDSRQAIRVNYDSVNGSLVPFRDIRGFLVEKEDVPIAITQSKRGKDGKSVIIKLREPAPEDANLWYGRGLFPVVNLMDRTGFPAPAFGPVKLK